MGFFKANKSTKTGDYIGAFVFIAIGWLMFFAMDEEIPTENPKAGIFLVLQGIGKYIGKWPLVILMNLIGLLLIRKGLRK